MEKMYLVEWGQVKPFNSIRIVCEESDAVKVALAIFRGNHRDKFPACLILTDMTTGKGQVLLDCM